MPVPLLLSAAALTPDSVVLDLAAGSGDPALTIAERVTRGRVIALDSSRAGLSLASIHARRLMVMSGVLRVLKHLHDNLCLLQQLHAATRPGGTELVKLRTSRVK